MERDLVFLRHALEILETEKKSPAQKIEDLFIEIFERTGAQGRTFLFTPPMNWSTNVLELAITGIREVVVAYVRLFEDPRTIPVTHYRRQKKTAIHLDSQFSRVLREVVIRTGREKLRAEDGTPAHDEFLDEPILFLKQEARAGVFPKTKKGGGLSRKFMDERFEMKLFAKGYRPMEMRAASQGGWLQPGP